MDYRKHITTALENWDGLYAAIFINAAKDDREYIIKYIKYELKERGYHYNAIKKNIAMVVDDIRNEVATYIVKEYRNYHYNNIKDASNNRKKIKNKILKKILEDVEN